MTRQQLSILNALVTSTIERLDELGGAGDDEREVAKIVGRWAVRGEIDKGPREHIGYMGDVE